MIVPIIASAQNKTEDKPIRFAMFVQDKTGLSNPQDIALLNDVLTAKLTKQGFSIIDIKVVLNKFKEAGIATKDEESLLSAPATRIAQAIGADLLLLASISSFENESREFVGEGTVYKTNNKLEIHSLQVTVKVIDAHGGGSIYADTVTADERISSNKNVKIASDNTIKKLINSVAESIAINITQVVPQIRDTKPIVSATVEFTVMSNVDGATVEIDGIAIGTTPGKFTAPQGIHSMRLSKQWLTTWERTVNVLPQQKFNITLKLSDEGLQSYTTIERLKADLAREKTKAEAEAYEKKTMTDANAYEKKTNADAEKIRAEGNAQATRKKMDAEIIKAEEEEEKATEVETNADVLITDDNNEEELQ